MCQGAPVIPRAPVSGLKRLHDELALSDRAKRTRSADKSCLAHPGHGAATALPEAAGIVFPHTAQALAFSWSPAALQGEEGATDESVDHPSSAPRQGPEPGGDSHNDVKEPQLLETAASGRQFPLEVAEVAESQGVVGPVLSGESGLHEHDDRLVATLCLQDIGVPPACRSPLLEGAGESDLAEMDGPLQEGFIFEEAPYGDVAWEELMSNLAAEGMDDAEAQDKAIAAMCLEDLLLSMGEDEGTGSLTAEGPHGVLEEADSQQSCTSASAAESLVLRETSYSAWN